MQTVLPTAEAAGLEVQQLPRDGTELNPQSTTPLDCLTIEAIMNTPPGDTILLEGHSGTLYDIRGDGNKNSMAWAFLLMMTQALIAFQRKMTVKSHTLEMSGKSLSTIVRLDCQFKIGFTEVLSACCIQSRERQHV